MLREILVHLLAAWVLVCEWWSFTEGGPPGFEEWLDLGWRGTTSG